MAVCKCGEKLLNHYFKDGGGALECPGCGKYEERRVVTFKAVLDVLKVLIASPPEEDSTMISISDGELKKRCAEDIPASIDLGAKLPERMFPLRVTSTEDVGNKLLGIQNSRLLKENQRLRLERDRLRAQLEN